jgi:hypothetical protein
MAPGTDMSERELRDHAKELLTAIVADIATSQSPAEQSNKSKWRGTAQAMAASGALHADARLQDGFSVSSLLAEFRALRASVLRLYEGSGASDFAGVRRFNEAVDEALMVSTTRMPNAWTTCAINSSASSGTTCGTPSRRSRRVRACWPSLRTIRSDDRG